MYWTFSLLELAVSIQCNQYSFLLLNLLLLREGEHFCLTKRNTSVSMAMVPQFSAIVALSLLSALSAPSPSNPDGILSFKARSVSFASASQSHCLVTDEHSEVVRAVVTMQ